MSGIRFGRAASDAHLEGILELQGRNTEDALGAEEVARDGFVTLRHDLALLRE